MKAKIIMGVVAVLALGFGYYTLIMETAPLQLKKDWVGVITYNNTSPAEIIIEVPFPGAVTGKEFSVVGEARGTWFYERGFSVEVISENGTLLAESKANVVEEESSWLSNYFIKFKADMRVPESYTGKAVLVLKKGNLSGLPENDSSISFPFTIEF